LDLLYPGRCPGLSCGSPLGCLMIANGRLSVSIPSPLAGEGRVRGHTPRDYLRMVSAAFASLFQFPLPLRERVG